VKSAEERRERRTSDVFFSARLANQRAPFAEKHIYSISALSSGVYSRTP